MLFLPISTVSICQISNMMDRAGELCFSQIFVFITFIIDLDFSDSLTYYK